MFQLHNHRLNLFKNVERCLPRVRRSHNGDGVDKKLFLKTISKSLHKLGYMRFAADKASSNLYEHFDEPTVVKIANTEIAETESCQTLKDFLEIHDVTLNYGRPETADQMSGSMYLHAGVEEDKCSMCLRLADQLHTLSINDLSVCLAKINWWSSEAGYSLALREILDKLDNTCVDRLHSLHFPLKDQLRFSYQWQSLMLEYKAKFPSRMLCSMVPTKTSSPHLSIQSPLAIPIIVSWLLLASSDQLHLEDPSGLATMLAEKLTVGLGILGEPELLACHAGLQSLAPGSETNVKNALEKIYGYRL